jgi:hypothetical protein
VLLTRDTLLSKFCEKSGYVNREPEAKWVKLTSSQNFEKGKDKNRESKGYINKSWHVRLRKPNMTY